MDFLNVDLIEKEPVLLERRKAHGRSLQKNSKSKLTVQKQNLTISISYNTAQIYYKTQNTCALLRK